jgi:hypothetical protein
VVKVADHPAINHRRVRRPRNRHPPLDFGLQPRIVDVKAKRVEAGDDISPQVTHFDLIDVRNVGSEHASTIGIEDKDIRSVAGPGDRRWSDMQRFQLACCARKVWP